MIFIFKRLAEFVLVLSCLSAQAGELTLLSYNAAFLPWVSKALVERRSSFAEETSRVGADIIALQEVWSAKSRRILIRDYKKSGYPYSAYINTKFTPKGIIGNGLLVVSKFPIQSVEFYRFRAFTRPEEFFAGKGALIATIEHPDFGPLQIVNTHLGAIGFQRPALGFNARDLIRHRRQMDELIAVLQSHLRSELPVFLMGDFNLDPRRWDLQERRYSETENEIYLKLKRHLDLRDSLADQIFSFSHRAITYDPVNNPFIRRGGDPNSGAQPLSRFDFIFYRPALGFELTDAKIVMDGVEGFILSDHYGVRATFYANQ